MCKKNKLDSEHMHVQEGVQFFFFIIQGLTLVEFIFPLTSPSSVPFEHRNIAKERSIKFFVFCYCRSMLNL